MGARLIQHWRLIPSCLNGLLWLALYRLGIVCLPNRYTRKFYPTYQGETLKIPLQNPTIQTTKKVINYLAKWVPWKTKCLDQALAVQQLLKQNGLASTLYLGMIKTKEEQWEAHAWVRCGTDWIIGYQPTIAYTIVGTYATV